MNTAKLSTNKKIPNKRPSKYSHMQIWLGLILLFSTLLSSCTPENFQLITASTPIPTVGSNEQTENGIEIINEALIGFRVSIPESPAAENGIILSILDEVTGLALNITRHAMQAEDATHFFIEIPFQVGSVIKYRYTRNAPIPVEEHTSDGRQVRYRMFTVEAPGVVEDIVTRWTDNTYQGPTGRIQGRVLAQDSGQPLANILVACGGAQTMTASDGTFLIEGLPPGIHNLVTYSLDGSYHIFQQGAQIASESTTPAEIRMQKASLVNITFQVTAPENSPPGVPLRIAGNLFQFGNTFANLSGGMSTIAGRMPAMAIQPDSSYSLTISLPAGTDLQYKYTLGDGFWNAEQAPEGGFLLRQIIIPETDMLVVDKIHSWSDGDGSFITFDVMAPENTPSGETVSIQFYPYGWTEPIPMWSLGGNRWVYLLYSPLKPLSVLNYRYCRNEQCNAADAINSIGYDSAGFAVDLSNPQNRTKETIPGWNWLSSVTVPSMDLEIAPRNDQFLRGIELQARYHPSWLSKYAYTLEDITRLNTNWLVLTPTWSFTRQNPPVLESVSGQDALWLDTLTSITLANRAGIQTALFPHPQFLLPVNEWWSNGTKDFSWWVVWFERYRVFLLHHADLAARSNTQTLIIGGDWLTPALPGGILADGNPSNVPEDAEARWRSIIQEIRTRFDGNLLWAAPFTPGNFQLPGFADSVDGIYLLWSAKLAEENNADSSILVQEANRLLNEQVQPVISAFQKPVILAVAYPSANGGITGCILDPRGGCLPFEEIAPPRPDNPLIELDLKEQSDVYLAMLQAVNNTDWIAGFVSREYYPPAVLMDKSTSVHGKPAGEIIRQIFEQWAAPNP
jgi:hypothetical protein